MRDKTADAITRRVEERWAGHPPSYVLHQAAQQDNPQIRVLLTPES